MHKSETGQAVERAIAIETATETDGAIPGLTIRGPDGRLFTPGAAMHLYSAWGFLGELTPTFTTGQAGSVMHIDRFDASRLLLNDPRNLGSWLLYEICAFMCAQLPAGTVLRFTLSRPLDALGTASAQVLMRLEALDRIGAEGIRFSVRGASMHVIEGLWRPTTDNRRRLGGALDEHRAALRQVPLRAVEPDAGSLSAALRGHIDTVRRLVAG
jgi:hypothetical protein